jgi:phosphoribosylpyrophosphate synthetase
MKNVFELSTPQKGSKCILGCDTIDESGTWVREIRALKKEYQKRVLLEMQMNKDKALVNLN